jgi:predicted metallopeptidase
VKYPYPVLAVISERLPNPGTEQIRVILHAKQHIPLNFNQLKNNLVFPMSIGTETECPS